MKIMQYLVVLSVVLGMGSALADPTWFTPNSGGAIATVAPADPFMITDSVVLNNLPVDAVTFDGAIFYLGFQEALNALVANFSSADLPTVMNAFNYFLIDYAFPQFIDANGNPVTDSGVLAGYQGTLLTFIQGLWTRIQALFSADFITPVLVSGLKPVTADNASCPTENTINLVAVFWGFLTYLLDANNTILLSPGSQLIVQNIINGTAVASGALAQGSLGVYGTPDVTGLVQNIINLCPNIKDVYLTAAVKGAGAKTQAIAIGTKIVKHLSVPAVKKAAAMKPPATRGKGSVANAISKKQVLVSKKQVLVKGAKKK